MYLIHCNKYFLLNYIYYISHFTLRNKWKSVLSSNKRRRTLKHQTCLSLLSSRTWSSEILKSNAILIRDKAIYNLGPCITKGCPLYFLLRRYVHPSNWREWQKMTSHYWYNYHTFASAFPNSQSIATSKNALKNLKRRTIENWVTSRRDKYLSTNK